MGTRRDQFLGAVGKTLISLGVLTLLFAAFQLWGTSFEERQGQAELASSFGDTSSADRAEGPTTAEEITRQLEAVDPKTAAPLPAPPEGEGLGVIRIPKVGVERFIVEGTAKADLKKGPGHYSSTPLPGQPGNSGIAGHRTTYGAPFNRIDELTPGDPIEVFTSQGKFVYEVMAPDLAEPHVEAGPGWRAVRPTQSDVLRDYGDNRLTLTACHPKYSAKLRIIVIAKLVADPAQAAPTPPPEPKPEPDGADTGGDTGDDTGEEVAASDEFAADLGWHKENLRPTFMYGGICLAVWLAAFLIARRRTRRWPVYLLFMPAFVLPLWFCYVYLDRTLPSL